MFKLLVFLIKKTCVFLKFAIHWLLEWSAWIIYKICIECIWYPPELLTKFAFEYFNSQKPCNVLIGICVHWGIATEMQPSEPQSVHSATTLLWSSSVLQLLYGPVHCYIQLLSSPAECYVSCPTTVLQLLSRPVQWFYSCPVQFSASSLAQPSPTLHSATTVAQSFSMHLACAIALKYDTLHHRLL